MESDLNANPADTTNTLLNFLVPPAYNKTTPDQLSSAPSSIPDPSCTVLLTQGLGYLSLLLSLLFAFGAVLGKQWLGYYKTSRFGHGTVEERGLLRHRRSRKMQRWHMQIILDILSVMLQVSLFTFIVSLAGNIYYQEKRLGLLIASVVAIGPLFYLATLEQTEDPEASNSDPSSDTALPSIALAEGPRAYSPSRRIQNEESFEAVKWVIKTSADSDTITEAAFMAMETSWIAPTDLQGIIDQLVYQKFHSAFDSAGQLSDYPGNACACYMAITHSYWLRIYLEFNIPGKKCDNTLFKALKENQVRRLDIVSHEVITLLDSMSSSRFNKSRPIVWEFPNNKELHKSTHLEWLTRDMNYFLFFYFPSKLSTILMDITYPWMSILHGNADSRTVIPNILLGICMLLGYKLNIDMLSKDAARSLEAVLLKEVILRLSSLRPPRYHSSLSFIIPPISLILEQSPELLHNKKPGSISIQVLSCLFYEGHAIVDPSDAASAYRSLLLLNAKESDYSHQVAIYSTSKKVRLPMNDWKDTWPCYLLGHSLLAENPPTALNILLLLSVTEPILSDVEDNIESLQEYLLKLFDFHAQTKEPYVCLAVQEILGTHSYLQSVSN
ncbi:hypothetical protein M422DRAFT_276521 [Sphaerobolus stellatus SS14]|uniref:DUF6535 domain-containing protein n=1 Tax=Sphaerobolus stellatus (strain SS14) TaxID=990650 RepID=A0A0C9T2H9_SPHS4|nr:hypothetical protein M422DRAFT_276521 [Sphaerobolus stellatus SS14]